jgi:hypothetical protein
LAVSEFIATTSLGCAPDHARQRVAHQFVVRHPLRLAGKVAFHGLRRPFVEDFLDMRARALRLQAQRIADEVGLRFAVVQRQVEFGAEVASGSAASSAARLRVGVGS